MSTYEKAYIALGVATLAVLGWTARSASVRRTSWAELRESARSIAETNRVTASAPGGQEPASATCSFCHANATACGLSRPFEIGEMLDDGEAEAKVAERFCRTVPEVATVREVRQALCTANSERKQKSETATCLEPNEILALVRAGEVYCGPSFTAQASSDFCLQERKATGVRSALSKATWDVPAWARTHPYLSILILKHQSLAAPSAGSNGAAGTRGVVCQECHGGDPVEIATHAVGRVGAFHSKDPAQVDPLLDVVEYGRHGDGHRGRLPALREAKCAVCHPDDPNLAHAPVLSRGRRLFRDLGCSGCHPLARFESTRVPGPQLRYASEKLDADWLVEWIRSPESSMPRTRMPSVFVPAIGEPATPEAKRERDEDSMAIAAYLWDDARENAPAARQEGKGDAASGKALFSERGCSACHPRTSGATNRPSSGSSRRDLAPNLCALGDRVAAPWLSLWLEDPQAWWREARMPRMGLAANEIADLVAYLQTLHADVSQSRGKSASAAVKLHDPELVKRGRAAVRKWGCFDCHLIRGFEHMHRMGADLDGFANRGPLELDFGSRLTAPAERNWFDWVDLKLREPYAYVFKNAGARMPQFHLAEEEVEALVVFLRSLAHSVVVPEELLAERGSRGAVVRGDLAVEEFGCKSCHAVDGKGGLIRDEYLTSNFGGYPVDDAERSKYAPPALVEEGFRTQPAWLYAYLRSPKPIRPYLHMTMPRFPLVGRFSTVASYDGEFGRDLAADLVEAFSYRAAQPFPFLYLSEEPLKAERHMEAEELYRELRCFACHEGPVAGARDPRASLPPDLRKVRERLRPEWIEHWLFNNKSIAPNTVMPAFFVEYGKGRHLTASKKRFHGDAVEQVRALSELLSSPQAPGAVPNPPGAAHALLRR